MRSSWAALLEPGAAHMYICSLAQICVSWRYLATLDNMQTNVAAKHTNNTVSEVVGQSLIQHKRAQHRFSCFVSICASVHYCHFIL